MRTERLLQLRHRWPLARERPEREVRRSGQGLPEPARDHREHLVV